MALIDDTNHSPMIAKILGATASTGATPPGSSPPDKPVLMPQTPGTAHSGRPPIQPPHIPGGGGNGGGFKEWGQNNRGWALILGLTGMLLVMILLFVILDFFNEKSLARLERLDRLTPPESVQPRVSVASSKPAVTHKAETPLRTVELQDGTTPTLPENARIVLHGPITNMVIVNSASRIKSFSGEFKLVLKADGTRAWTSGFNSKPTPNSMQEFIDRLPKPPEQSEVWIFVPPSTTLELIT